ncbi:MAG: aldose epimerase family protein [Sulfitobacter sp.]
MPPPIEISSGLLSATVLPRGATLAAVRFGTGAPNLLLGFADPQDHARVPIYAGALVGPVANRITGGRINIDGTRCQMPLNEAGGTTLHSGPDGLHALDWDVVRQTAQSVTLCRHLPDGAQGLPGDRKITATYRVEGCALWLDITAQTTRTTPMNIAAHPYWNLDQRRDVAGHLLQVNADHVLPVDAQNLPTGARASTQGTLFDFSTLRAVPLTPALDVNFCLADAPHAAPQAAAILRGANGCQLDIATTAPGLQVYAGAFTPDMPGALEGGRDLCPYAGIALEPQLWPDAPRHSQFPSILLTPGQTWRQTTCFSLTPPAP